MGEDCQKLIFDAVSPFCFFAGGLFMLEEQLALLFQLFLIFNISRRTKPFDDLTRFILDGYCLVQMPSIHTIHPSHSTFSLIMAAVLLSCRPVLAENGYVVRMDERLPTFNLCLCQRYTCKV